MSGCGLMLSLTLIRSRSSGQKASPVPRRPTAGNMPRVWGLVRQSQDKPDHRGDAHREAGSRAGSDRDRPEG